MARYLLIFLQLLVATMVYAQASTQESVVAENTAIMSKIALATAQTPTEFINGYLFMPYHSTKAYRAVGIAFSYENYEIIHPFVLNKKGTYVFYGKIPDNVHHLGYRLIVDSVWQADSSNPVSERDVTGVEISMLELNRSNDIKLGPQIRTDGFVDFYLQGKPQSQVFISGSFSHWDPFIYPVKEISPGLYKVSIPLSYGRHYYAYLIDGQRIVDPHSFKQTHSYAGEIVSFIDIQAKSTT
jgi:hypothetical protein